MSTSNCCIKLFNSIQKYGKKCFKIELLIITHTQEIADYWETYFINQFKTVEFGYNLRSGGSRGKHSEVSKAKMRKPKSEEAKVNMSKAQLQVDRSIGRSHSDISRTKMRKPKSEVARENMSKSVKVRKLDISISLRGKKRTPENIEKLSLANRGKKMSEQAKLKMKKPKLTFEIAEMIRADASEKKFTFGELSEKYKVSISTIGKIVSFKTHKSGK